MVVSYNFLHLKHGGRGRPGLSYFLHYVDSYASLQRYCGPRWEQTRPRRATTWPRRLGRWPDDADRWWAGTCRRARQAAV